MRDEDIEAILKALHAIVDGLARVTHALEHIEATLDVIALAVPGMFDEEAA